MTQNYAVNSNNRPGARDTSHSSCSNTVAGRRRPSFRKYSSTEGWASSVELACDLSKRAAGAATAALLSAFSPSSPGKPNNNGAVMCLSLTSAAANFQAEAHVHERSTAQVWTERIEGKSRVPLLTLEECSASFSVPNVNSNGASSAARSAAAPGATVDADVSQVSPCSVVIPSPRTQHAAAGATTASGSPDAATPSSTASVSPARKPCSTAGVMKTAEEDAPRTKTRATPPHFISPVVDGPRAEIGDTSSHGEAAAPPRGAAVVEDTSPARDAFKVPQTSGESDREDSAPYHDEPKADVASSCAWSGEPNSAETLQLCVTARPAEDRLTTRTAGPRLCLSREAVEAAVTPAGADAAFVARGISSRTASPAAVAAVKLTATSVVGTKPKNEDRAGRAEQGPGTLHEGQIETDCHSGSSSTQIQRTEGDALAARHAPTQVKDLTSGRSQQAQIETGPRSVRLNESEEGDTAHSSVHQGTGRTTDGTQTKGTSSEPAISTDTKKGKTLPVDERAGRLSDKLRAKFKREFNRSWVDINSAPSWPPIKKTKYLTSDWKIVDLRVGATQRQEKKKNRLFLNSLCYLFDGVYTQKSTLGRKAGLGLFCERPEGFRKGQIITEFVGWLVDREQAESYRKQRAASHIVAVQKGFLYIDGAKEPTYGMGGGSFANDGSEFLGGPGNNAHFYHWFDDELGRTRVFIRATADIRSGQEIFVPYERTYWVDNFEEQAENCPEPFRKKKLEQLRKKIRHVEELHKSRLAANKQKASSSAAATVSHAARTSANQRALQQREEGRQLREKNNRPRINLKRPLSAYMLFSKERRRELLLQHYRPAEQQVQLQVSSAAPGGDAGAYSVLSPNEKQAPPLQPVKTQRHEKPPTKDEDTPPALTLEGRRLAACAGTANSPRGSELEEGRRRLRSRKLIDSSVAGSAGGVDACDPQGVAYAVVQQPERAGIREEGMDTSALHTRDSAAAGTAADAAGGFAVSVRGGKEEAGVQTRRRSNRLSQGAAPSACLENAAADETLSLSAEAERAAAAAPTGATRRSSGELASGKPVRTLTGGGTTAKWGEDGKGTSETVEGRRRSPRWLQASNRGQLPAAAAGLLAEKNATRRNDVQNSGTGEDFVGRLRTLGTKAREANEEGHHSNRNMGIVDSTQSDYAIENRKTPRALSTGEATSKTCPLFTAAPCCQKRKRSAADEENTRTAAAEACTHVAAAARQSPNAPAPVGPKAEAILEQEARSDDEVELVDEQPGASKSRGGAEEAPQADAVAVDRKNAVLQHFASVIRRVAGEWSAMPALERRRWERLAAKQRERYVLLRQRYTPKQPRRNTKQRSRCTRKKPLPHKTKTVLHTQKRKGVKLTGTAEGLSVPAKAVQSTAAPQKALAANSAVAAAGGTTRGSSVAPEGAAAAEPKEAERNTRASASYRSAVVTRMELQASEFNDHSVGGKEGDAEQTGASKEAKWRPMGRKSCVTRAAKRAAEGATERSLCNVSQKHTVRHEQAQAEQLQEEQRKQPQQPRDARHTGEGRHHCHTTHAQQPKRSRRHVDMAETSARSKKATPDSVSQQKPMLSFSSWSFISRLSSCSTTRSSSSRNSSRGSRGHTNTDTSRNCQVPHKRNNLSLSTGDRADACVQVDSVRRMREGQQDAIDAERQGAMRSRQHQREQKSEQSKSLQGLPAMRQQRQSQRGRRQQRESGERPQSGPRKEFVPVCSGEQRARGKRRRSWSPSCATRADRAFSATS